MRNWFGITICLFLIVGSAYGLTLADKGSSSYVIVVADDASEPEKNAAADLQSYLKAVTGADYSIQAVSKLSAESHRIFVGQSRLLKQLASDVPWKELKSDTILIRTVGDDLLLAGGRPRGTLYAVYTFLEDVVGVRWWTSTEEFVPEKPTLRIGEIDRLYTPPFEYRELFYRDVCRNHRFGVRLKTNGHFSHIPSNYGGHYSILGFCHTIYNLLPPKKYFAAHPEWYSLVGGKRTHARNAQLCFTNEAMRKELSRNALAQIRKHPDAGIISVSQRDARGMCECAKCRALEKKEATPSGPLLDCVNAVAADIAKEYPNFLVETLAYHWSQKPPSHLKAAPNVMIRLCTLENAVHIPISDPVNHPANVDFRKDLVNWGKVASNLFIWDYATNFWNYLAPHPNLGSFGSNLRFYAKNNVVGVYEQGDSHTTVGDFNRLRVWLVAHLLWNPDADEKKLRQEFLEGYYGKAAPYLANYLDLRQRCARAGDRYFDLYNMDWSFLTLKDMNQCVELFQAAEKAVADDPELALRVRRERLSFDYLWFLRYPWLKAQAEATKTPFLGPDSPVADCDAFIADAYRLNEKGFHWSESRRDKEMELCLRRRAKASERGLSARVVPEECKNLDAKDWMEVQDYDCRVCWAGGVEMLQDSLASDGMAIKMRGNIIDWFVGFWITGDMLYEGWPQKKRCYLSVRVDAAAKEGKAYSVGIYDFWHRKEIMLKKVNLQDVPSGTYHTCDLGVHALSPGMFIWFVPSGDEKCVKSISVDRVFFVSEKDSPKKKNDAVRAE